MGRRTKLAVGLVVAALSGCGTVHNLKQPTHPPASNPDASVCRAYGGVRGDWAAMAELPWRGFPSDLDYVVIPALCVFDLVFTSAGDTVTLPYTVGSEIARAVYYPEPLPPVVAPGP